jgi:hypothetical protein
MAFMVPFYTNEPFDVVTHENGESESFPHPIYAADLDEGDEIEHVRGKFWCRLSAPGYMDCTDWSGPFDTLAEARAHIRDLYDVDPDTGDELDAD